MKLRTADTHLRKKTSPDLLSSLSVSDDVRSGSPAWVKFLVALLLVGIGAGSVFTFRIFASVSNAFSAGDRETSVFTKVRELLVPPERAIKGEERDRINIILAGIGGEGHDGPLLTDTLIVASVKPSTHQAGLFSIPRDLVVNLAGYGYRKINNAYPFGVDRDGPDGGRALLQTSIETVIGDTVDYFVLVDFAGFEKVIDDLGGIDVTVEQSFVDRSFPTDNHGYQTITFTAGPQHFDGRTALNFVRSRHGSNGENSDFARSKRQQLVLVALREKIFSFGTLLNPIALGHALETLGDHVTTTFEPWEALRLSSLVKVVDRDAFGLRGLDASTDGLLHVTTGTDGAYLLESNDATWGEAHRAFATLFDAAREDPEDATIEVENATTRVGLAARTADALERHRLSVTSTRNATERLATTTIFDFTEGAKPVTLTLLKTVLNAPAVIAIPALDARGRDALNVNDYGTSIQNADVLRRLLTSGRTLPDFLVVVGNDSTL